MCIHFTPARTTCSGRKPESRRNVRRMTIQTLKQVSFMRSIIQSPPRVDRRVDTDGITKHNPPQLLSRRVFSSIKHQYIMMMFSPLIITQSNFQEITSNLEHHTIFQLHRYVAFQLIPIAERTISGPSISEVCLPRFYFKFPMCC